VPAAFYVWLMVWMGCSLRFLTDKLSRQKQEMEHMALHDALSGLPNRNLLTDRLNTLVEMSKRHGTRFALVMIDLDGFKDINDSLGHDAGDTLLRAIAQRLGGCMRSVDTVARVGGDEFVLLLDGLDTHASREICERVAAEIARPVPFRDADVCVGASIGIAVFPDHGNDAETLTCNADHAMYAVKAEGGGIRLYDSVSTSGKAKRPQRRAVPA
jgi:diguanylate cyclase (GGDEF)-like protein